MGKAIGYIRVSTTKQDNEAQRSAICEAVAKEGLKLETIFEETISSRKAERKVYSVIEGLKKGDTLIVYELSRLGRSMPELYSIVESIKKKGAVLWVLSPSLKLGTGLSKQEETMSGVYMFALSLASQIERDFISERTKNGLKARKEAGVILGRPKGKGVKVEAVLKEKGIPLEKFQEYIKAGISSAGIARLIGVDTRTVINYKKSKGV